MLPIIGQNKWQIASPRAGGRISNNIAKSRLPREHEQNTCEQNWRPKSAAPQYGMIHSSNASTTSIYMAWSACR
jgi:hypothetical protein